MDSNHFRRIHVFGVGAPKSGTHSIAGIFKNHYRSGHEVEVESMISRVSTGATNTNRWLLDRDQRLELEVDVSSVLMYFVRELVELFPQAKFILTVRQPLAWLRSIITHMHTRPVSMEWRQFREYRFQSHPFQQHDQCLARAGLYSIDSLLDYWAMHNRSVLNAVPVGRLLVLPTEAISDSLDSLSRFVGVSPQNLDSEHSKLFQANRDSPLFAEIPEPFLLDRINVHCRDVIRDLTQ